MREVQRLYQIVSCCTLYWSFLPYLALGQLRFDPRPGLTLSSIGEQVHDDCALRDSFIHLEKICAWYPAILHGFFPRGTVFPNADDDIQTVVT